MYSNPTGLYNLSVTEKALRTSTGFQIVTYKQFKESQVAPLNDAAAAEAQENPSLQAEQEQEVLNWAISKEITPILLRIEITNTSGKTVKVGVKIVKDGEEEPNVNLPLSGFKVQVFGGTQTSPHLAGILQKIDPTKPFGKFKLEVEAKFVVRSYQTSGTANEYVASGTGTGGSTWHDSYA